MLKFYFKELSNNLTVFIIKTKKLSSLDITLYVKVGSVYENKENNGISHLLEHLLFLKTKQSNLHSVGLDIYPYTRKDFTYFEITTHKNLIKDALLDLSSIIMSPNFTEDNLKIIKKICLEEIAESYDDYDNILNQKIDQFLYQKNSLAFSIGGSENNVRNITLTDLKNWYKNYYTPDNMILTIVGDINIRKTLKQINNVFNFNDLSISKVSRKEKINKKIIYPNIPSRPIKLKGINSQQTHLAFVFPTVGINSSKYIPCILLAEILNREMRQRFENSGLLYNIQLNYYPYLNTGEFRIITACKKNNVNKIIKEINTFVNNIKISDDSFFIRIKEYVKYQFLLKKDNVDELSSMTLYLLNNKAKLITLNDEISKIDNINLSEINKVRKRYFNKKNVYCFVFNK